MKQILKLFCVCTHENADGELSLIYVINGTFFVDFRIRAAVVKLKEITPPLNSTTDNNGKTNPHINYDASPTVSEAINTRRSLRAFLPEPVSAERLKSMLSCAARAPSGTNIQPWQTYVLTGKTRRELCDAVCAEFDSPSEEHGWQSEYYPSSWFEPYLQRRRDVGWQLYGLLGIAKGDRAATHAQHRRNFQFFDAPVGLIFTIHKDLATGSWLDYGMFMQNIMLLARENALHTCPQAAWCEYHKVIRRILSINEDEIIVSGMAVGKADPAAIENTLVTDRASIEDSVRFFE